MTLADQNRALKEALEAARPYVLAAALDPANSVAIARLAVIYAALAAEPASGETSKVEALQAERNALRDAIAEARRRLAKGRALWNGPCHECDAVLARWDFIPSSPSPPPTQGEEETALNLMSKHRLQFHGQFSHERIDARTEFHNDLTATLRQRADEARETENEACALVAETSTFAQKPAPGPAREAARTIAAAIRARITPEGQDDGR